MIGVISLHELAHVRRAVKLEAMVYAHKQHSRKSHKISQLHGNKGDREPLVKLAEWLVAELWRPAGNDRITSIDKLRHRRCDEFDTMQLVYLVPALIYYQWIDCRVVGRGEILQQVNPVGSESLKLLQKRYWNIFKTRPIPYDDTGLTFMEIGEATHLCRPPPRPSRWWRPSYTRPDVWQGNV